MKNKSITNMTNIHNKKDETKNIKPLIYLENALRSISKIRFNADLISIQ